MQIYARIAGDVVAELIEIPADGPPLQERYHPALVAAMVPVTEPGEVAPGWSWDGETFTPPAPPAPVVPDSITRTQGLIALLGIGITEQRVRDRIGLIEDPTSREIARLRFEGATWGRNSPFIAWGAGEFGLSDEQVDSLFIGAATL